MNLGILGDLPRISPKYGEGDRGRVFKGFGDILGTGRKFSKVSGTYWGRGKLKFWGISGIYSPKIFEFQGEDGDNNFGEFANSCLTKAFIT